jgi:hypothetical protein
MWNMKNLFLLSIICGIVIGTALPAVAQTQTTTPKHLMREDSAAVNALVMYPDSVRLDIFEASEYPSAIVSIATTQQRTSSAFDSLIGGYSKTEQEDLWNLTRYPDLIAALAEGGQKSNDEIDSIVAGYPADIHDVAVKYGKDYYATLQQIDNLQSQSNAQFNQIISDYPDETQHALNQLLQYPEIINLLNDHLSLTVRVGDRFRRDPQRVIHRADSLHLALTVQDSIDAQAWKDSLAQNPDEQADLSNAANDYAQDNGYSQQDLSTAPESDYVANYTCAPYSYWFGYPTWYPYSYWYPYPYWFDCGFYHDRYGRMVIIGSPSPYFTNWYFYSPEHLNRYPYLANSYVRHYYGTGRGTTRNSLIVRSWVHQNRNYLPSDFVTNGAHRTEAIRQVAQLNVDVQKEHGGKPVDPAVRDKYYQDNRNKYTALKFTPVQPKMVNEKDQNFPVAIEPPVRQPTVRLTTTEQRPAVKSNPTPTSSPREASPQPTYSFKEINKAQQYHQNVWEQTQPVRQSEPVRQEQPVVRQQEPVVRQQPSPGRHR